MKTDFVSHVCAWRALVIEFNRVRTPRTRKPIPDAIEFVQELGGKFCDYCKNDRVDCTRNMYFDEIPPVTLKDFVFDVCNDCAANVVLRGTGPGNWPCESEPTWRFPYKIMVHKIETDEFCKNCQRNRTTRRVAITPFADDESKCADFRKEYLGRYNKQGEKIFKKEQ